MNYIAVVGPELMGKYYGEAEARLRQLFERAAKSAPCLVFIDEIDALVPNRSTVEGEVEKRLVAQLLGLMDGFVAQKGIVVLAATNRPEALIRPCGDRGALTARLSSRCRIGRGGGKFSPFTLATCP